MPCFFAFAIIRPPDLWTFFSFFFVSTALSSHALVCLQMYFDVFQCIVGKASTIGMEISPTPLLFFTEGSKVRNLASFSHHSTLSQSRLKMQQDIWTLKLTSCVEMNALTVLTMFSEVGSTHPWELFVSRAPPLKLHSENVLNRQ